MAGLVPAIHVLILLKESKAWIPGTRPGMTMQIWRACTAKPPPY